MNAYTLAIRALCDRLDNANLSGVQISHIFSVLRGPDDEDETLKALYTAPLRLYLLGEDAYRNAGYAPDVDTISTDLRTPKSSENHYLNHIRDASHILKDAPIPPANEPQTQKGVGPAP